jgi:hypothetical protein
MGVLPSVFADHCKIQTLKSIELRSVRPEIRPMQLILLLELVMIILETVKVFHKLIAVEGEPIHRE